MITNEQAKPGTDVQANLHNSPRMTIESVRHEGTRSLAKCVWFDNNKVYRTQDFPIQVLNLAEPIPARK